MKKLFKMNWVIMALFISALILTFGACGEDEIAGNGIDWTDYKIDFSIRVSNNTKKDLVAFQSSLSPENMLGGILSGDTNHGLKNDTAKFGKNVKQFTMIFITREQYEANKNKLSQLNNDYFTQIRVYWNGSAGDNLKVYEISDKLGGDYQLVVQNDSKFDVEIRIDGPSGPILGFAPFGMITNKLYVGVGTLNLYPVFKYNNERRGIIETIYPTREDGTAWRQVIVFQDNTPPQSLNLKTALTGISKRSSGVCYLKIFNNTTEGGAIGFKKGTTIMVNTMNIAEWNSGESKEFVIEMPTVSGSTTYASEIQIDNYFVFQTSDDVLIKTVENEQSSMTLKADMLYSVYVTGAPGSLSNPFKARVEIREGETNGPTPIEFSPLF